MTNITLAINYACTRAAIAGAKKIETGIDFWCETAISMIDKANKSGKVKDIAMADA